MQQKNEMNYTFAIHTLGCKVNTYESDIMAQAMTDAGFTEKSFSEPADIYIINTCTVTNIADRKSRQMLRRARKQNPKALIAAAGCYIEDAKLNGKIDELIREKVIDVAVGNREKTDIVAFVTAELRKNSSIAGLTNEADIGDTANGTGSEDTTGSEITEAPFSAPAGKQRETGSDDGKPHFLTRLDGHTRAFIKIQDGCNMFCSYCVIPYVRGRGKLWFRDTDEIKKEITGLAEKGVSEVVLTGIHLSSMKDRLIEVIEAAASVEKIKRIRLGSLEPTLFTEEFVKKLKRTDKLCPHFHLSLQSGSDTVLRRMNRHYTADRYIESCENIKKYYEHPAITTDIIVGFPGETDEEFRETCELCRKVGFYEAHVFKYSRRSGTVADKLPGQLTDAEKSERSDILIELSEKLSHEFRASCIGKNVSFLSEELITLSGETYETGYTENYLRCIKKTDSLHLNSIVSGDVLEIRKENDIDEVLVLI